MGGGGWCGILQRGRLVFFLLRAFEAMNVEE